MKISNSGDVIDAIVVCASMRFTAGETEKFRQALTDLVRLAKIEQISDFRSAMEADMQQADSAMRG